MSWTEQSKSLLQELIRCEAVNPTSNEEKAAKLVATMLKSAGIETHLLHPEGHKNRLSVVARIPGKNPNAAKLGLMGHLDVVPAGNPDMWSYPPFSGEEAEGFIWGRGAFDCGITVASETTAFIRLAEEGFEPEGDLILIATADEEVGGEYGAKFLTDEHWDKVGVDYVINEGGGVPISSSEKGTKYSLSSSEKGPFWNQLTIKGQPGHASIPMPDKNTVCIASEVIRRLSNYKSKTIVTQTFKKMIDGWGLPSILKTKFFFNLLYPVIKKIMPDEAALISAMVRMTFSPTVIEGGEKVNIIPAKVKLSVDSRIVPTQTLEQADHELHKAIGSKLMKKIDVNPVLYHEGTESSLDTSLFQTIDHVMKGINPSSTIVPIVLSATTDSRYWRLKGSIAYGFTPMNAFLPVSKLADLPHNYNERVDLVSIRLQHEFMYEIAKAFQSKKHKRII